MRVSTSLEMSLNGVIPWLFGFGFTKLFRWVKQVEKPQNATCPFTFRVNEARLRFSNIGRDSSRPA